MLLSSQSVNIPEAISGASHNPQAATTATGGFVEVDAYAKINLFLKILGVRNDGYHQLSTIMQAISLKDNITISIAPPTQKEPITLKADIRNIAGGSHTYGRPVKLSTGDGNLVVQGAKLLMGKYNITTPINIGLKKRIPIGAGLGGGSSDAAATLLAIKELFDIDITLDKLLQLGTTLGADVPFCILANHKQARVPTAAATGIGEVLTPLKPHPRVYMVVACMPYHVSTKEIFKEMYKHMNIPSFTGKNQTEDMANILSALQAQDRHRIAKQFYNDFTQVTAHIFPKIAEVIKSFKCYGAMGAQMSGTGPTVYAYFPTEDDAIRTCNRIRGDFNNIRFIVLHTM